MADGTVGVSARGRFAVLLYALAVEDVVALGFDCVLGYIVAEPTYGRFNHVGREVGIRLAFEDKIGMARLTPA